MAASWHVRFFGGLILEGPDRTITRFRTQRTASLLAYLAYHLGRNFPREVLANMLWPGDPVTGRHSLSTALTSLRHQVELPGLPASSVLIADRYCVALSGDTVSTDVIQFKAALLRAEQAGTTHDRIHALQQAVDLYRGEFLPGFYEEWVSQESLVHSEQFANALCDLTLLLEKRGDNVAAIEYARRAIQVDSLREEPYRELMRLYAGMGEPSTALRYYRDLVHIFRTEFPDEPLSPETLALARKIQAAQAPAETSPTIEAAPGSHHGRRRPERSRPAATGPVGTVALLLIEAALSSQDGPLMLPKQLARGIEREIQNHGGHVATTPPHRIIGVFTRAADAVASATAVHSALARSGRRSARRPTIGTVIHTGDVEQADNVYEGPAVEHLERLVAAAHEGQILCSEATAGLLRPALDGGASIRRIGTYQLGDPPIIDSLFQINYPGQMVTDFPPPRAAQGYPSNLPLKLPRFFGREQEIQQIEAMLTSGDSRLITLAGPPGVGKSRLAIEVATRIRQSFPGAIYYIALSELRDPSRIASEILEALSIEPSIKSGILTQLTRALSRERTLLILDDMEHLASGAPLVRSLLEDCPQLRVLITSREWLRLPGEREVVVAPLPTPSPSDPPETLTTLASVRLFLDRAQALRSDFELTAGNAAALAEICRRLEGLPLAIELAASCVHTMSFPEVLEFFEHKLDLPINEGEKQARHSTLRAALDWSCDRLPPGHQRFFARLAVFRGGWTAEAAEVVCAEPLALDYLADLSDCSLIQAEHSSHAVRFSMLDLVRQYALERLLDAGEAETAQARHRDFYQQLGEKVATDPDRGASANWMDVLEADHDNLLAAMECFRSDARCVPTALRLAVVLHPFWCQRGHTKLGRKILSELLQLPEAPQHSQLRAEALRALGVLCREEGSWSVAERHLGDSFALYREHDDTRGTASVLHEMGVLHAELGRWDRAQASLLEALRLIEGSSLQFEAKIRGELGAAYLGGDQPERAKDELERVVEIERQLGDRPAMATDLTRLATALRGTGETSRLDPILRESLAIRREIGDLPGAARVLLALGAARTAAGDHALAARRVQESMEIARELGSATLASEALTVIADIEAAIARTEPSDSARSRWACAVKLVGAACSLGAESRGREDPWALPAGETLRSEARAALGEESFASALAAGQAMNREEALSFALATLKELAPGIGVIR